MIAARQDWLSQWDTGTKRGRFDYDCSEHLLEEMNNASYFGSIYHCFNAGDYIFVTDAKDEHSTFVIDSVSPAERKVWFSIVERFVTTPVTASTEDYDCGMAIKWRGPRGGMFCIVDGENNVKGKDYRTRVEAERELQAMLVREKAVA